MNVTYTTVFENQHLSGGAVLVNGKDTGTCYYRKAGCNCEHYCTTQELANQFNRVDLND